MFFLIIGCSKDSIPDPDPVVLTAPQNGDNCNTSTSISFDQSRVTFSWIKSDNTDYYEVVAISKLTNSRYNDTTSGIQSNGEVLENISNKLILPKNQAYTWSVTSISNSTTSVKIDKSGLNAIIVPVSSQVPISFRASTGTPASYRWK